jgi:hypothetical protein
MISHLNGSFFAIALRNVESATFSRTTNVPTAPMFTTSNFFNCVAKTAGLQRFAPPTFAPRRKTTLLTPGVNHNDYKARREKLSLYKVGLRPLRILARN